MPCARPAFACLALAACLVLSGCGARSGPDDAEARSEPDYSKWQVNVDDGKTGTIICGDVWCVSFSDDYHEMLRQISSEAAARVFTPPLFTRLHLLDWHEWRVIDVTNTEEKHKAILLSTGRGRLRPLYVCFPWAAAMDLTALPEIRDLNGVPVLTFRSDVEGSAGGVLCLDYVRDAHSGLPVPIDDSAIATAFAAAVPAGYRPHGGKPLDLFGLRYSAAVAKPDDAKCCPTGGSISMRLTFDGRRLNVAEVSYDPTPIRGP